MRSVIYRVFCLFLCAALALSAFAVAARAAQIGTLTENAGWRFENGRLTVSGTGDIPNGAISRAISAFSADITAVTVEAGITTLGRMAFQGCANLTDVSLPSTLKTISDSAFRGCENLKKINVPAGVQVICGSAFMDCVNLSDVTLPASVHSIDDAAFRGCTALREISLPAALSYIGVWEFMGSGLESVVLPGSVRQIGGWAFAQCVSLKNVILSAGLTTLPDCVFQNSALEFVMLPGSIQTLRDYSFYNCTLKQVYYEGTRDQFWATTIWAASEDVPGTASKLLKTAEVKKDVAGLRGDMDGKDGVTAADARTVLRSAVKLEAMVNASAEFYRADVNADAQITSADARLVLRAAVKLEDLTSLQPYRPSPVDEKTLSSLEGYTGTLNDLLKQYDVELLFGAPEHAVVVFPGEKDMRVLMFDTVKGAYFNRRVTPTASSADLNAVKRGSTSDDVKKIDPGVIFNVYEALGGAVTSAGISCTTDGRVYLITYNRGVITDIYVY